MLTHSVMELQSGAKVDFINEVTLQHESEMKEFIDFMAERGPLRDVIEIGVWEGGTTYLFAQLVGDEGHIYAIDREFGSVGSAEIHANGIPPVYRGTVFEKQVVEIKGLFEDEKVIGILKGILNGRKVDLLFHDGDHHYEAVKRDIANYGPFVKDGGWIGVCDWMDDSHGVSRYWPELKEGREFQEFVIQRQPPELAKSHRWIGFRNGIGLVKWDGKP